MKKAFVIATIVTAVMSQSPSAHAENETEKGVGLASGALVGAAAGGPLGFVIGAALGGLIGDEVGKAGQVDELKTELSQSQNKKEQLEQQLAELKEKASVKNSDNVLVGSEMLQMDLMFPTNVTGLDDSDHKRIEQLASFLNRHPGLTVKLDGFADPRGKKEENKKLSEQRVETVKRILVSQGINEERILSTAHGEENSLAPKGDLDAYALERRVSIRFFPQSEQTFAANQ